MCRQAEKPTTKEEHNDQELIEVYSSFKYNNICPPINEDILIIIVKLLLGSKYSVYLIDSLG